MTRAEKEALDSLLQDAYDSINQKLNDETDRFYSNFIFEPDYPGQTARDKYESYWGREDAQLLADLQKAILELDE